MLTNKTCTLLQIDLHEVLLENLGLHTIVQKSHGGNQRPHLVTQSALLRADVGDQVARLLGHFVQEHVTEGEAAVANVVPLSRQKNTEERPTRHVTTWQPQPGSRNIDEDGKVFPALRIPESVHIVTLSPSVCQHD